MDYIFKRTYRGRVQAVVLDWAGTAVDFGSFAPTAVFMRLFEQAGVPITAAQARTGMGLMKRDHLRTILEDPDVRDRWRQARGAVPNGTDLDSLFTQFVPMQLACIADFAEPIPGLLGAVASLRKQGIKIGSTTGYTRPMLDALLPEAAKHGYTPDACLCPSDVPAGRPSPWMCYRNAIELQVFPMESMVKVGDSLPDIEEGLNAGMWSVGLALSGNLLGLTLDEVRSLPAEEVDRQRTRIARQLYQAGAHYVVDTIADIPQIVESIGLRLAHGERP
jgi:phosphonoacetaldehyde hydrolase